MLARVLAHHRRRTAARLAADLPPDLWGLDHALYAAAVPVLPAYWRTGARIARADVRQLRKFRSPPARKALRFDTGGTSPPGGNPPAADPLSALSVAFDLVDPRGAAECRRLALQLAGEVSQSTRDGVRRELAAGFESGESYSQMGARLEEWFSPRRAYTIARTEAGRVMGESQMATWREYGIERHTWLASSDACSAVCLPLDGKTVAIGEPFLVHATGRPAYRVVTAPPGHVACQCTTVPAVE